MEKVAVLPVPDCALSSREGEGKLTFFMEAIGKSSSLPKAQRDREREREREREKKKLGKNRGAREEQERRTGGEDGGGKKSGKKNCWAY